MIRIRILTFLQVLVTQELLSLKGASPYFPALRLNSLDFKIENMPFNHAVLRC